MAYKGPFCLTGKRSAVQICQSSQQRQCVDYQSIRLVSAHCLFCVYGRKGVAEGGHKWVYMGTFGRISPQILSKPTNPKRLCPRHFA